MDEGIKFILILFFGLAAFILLPWFAFELAKKSGNKLVIIGAYIFSGLFVGFPFSLALGIGSVLGGLGSYDRPRETPNQWLIFVPFVLSFLAQFPFYYRIFKKVS